MTVVEDAVADDEVQEREDKALERAEAMADEGDERPFDERLKAARDELGLDPETAQERRTLADLAADEPEPEPEVEQYTLFGTAPKVNSQIKGAGRVGQSMVKVRSLQQPLPGQFDMDDVVECRVKLRVDKVEVAAVRDKDGTNTGSKRVHHTTMIALESVGDVDPAFAEVDARDRDAELAALRDRIAELEAQLATA